MLLKITIVPGKNEEDFINLDIDTETEVYAEVESVHQNADYQVFYLKSCPLEAETTGKYPMLAYVLVFREAHKLFCRWTEPLSNGLYSIEIPVKVEAVESFPGLRWG